MLQGEATCPSTSTRWNALVSRPLGSPAFQQEGRWQQGQLPSSSELREMSSRRGPLAVALRPPLPDNTCRTAFHLPAGRRHEPRSGESRPGLLEGRGQGEARPVPNDEGSRSGGSEGADLYGRCVRASYPLPALINNFSINTKELVPEAPVAFPGHILMGSPFPRLHALLAWTLRCPLFSGAVTPFAGPCCSTRRPPSGRASCPCRG